MAASPEDAALPAIEPNSILSFLGIRKKDLPYGGKLGTHSVKVSQVAVPSSLIGHGGNEASQILCSLTGVTLVDDCVANTSSKKKGQSKTAASHAGSRPNSAAQAPIPNSSCTAFEGGAERPSPTMDSREKGPPCIDVSLDTTDLSYWSYMVLPDRKLNQEEEAYSEADSEELERRAAIEKIAEKVNAAEDEDKADEHTKREEFRARVKESMSFVTMRMQMLQELGLGERDESVAPAGGSDTSFMSTTSVLMKQARRLAGILHTEEQAVRLQDVFQWFQSIGKSLGDDALGASPKSSSLHNQLDRLRSLHVAKDLYQAAQDPKASPTATPRDMLQQVEHDMRDRLANLYQAKNFILSNQAGIWANGKSETDPTNKESTYEILGTTILESLKEVERMEEDFHALQSELLTNGCPLLPISQKKKKGKKSSHKGKKKGGSSESDTGSSPSELSSAQSSSRPATQPSEPPPDLKAADESNPQADTNGSPKPKKKAANGVQKNDKKKGAKKEAKIKSGQPEVPNAEANAPLQSSGLMASSSTVPEPEMAPPNRASKGESADVSTPAASSTTNQSNAPGQDGPSSKPINEGIHAEGGDGNISAAQPRSSVADKPTEQLPRASKEEGQLVGVENKLALPKVSLSIQDVEPKDSASMQVMSKPKRKSRSAASKDQIVQTDDVAILALEDADVDTIRLREYQAADIKELIETLKKMQKQLQFWRTRNWAGKHTRQGHMLPPPEYKFGKQFNKVDVLPDMGMVCYYNSQTGVQLLKSVAELDDYMRQSVMSLVAGPGQTGADSGVH